MEIINEKLKNNKILLEKLSAIKSHLEAFKTSKNQTFLFANPLNKYEMVDINTKCPGVFGYFYPIHLNQNEDYYFVDAKKELRGKLTIQKNNKIYFILFPDTKISGSLKNNLIEFDRNKYQYPEFTFFHLHNKHAFYLIFISSS